MEELGRVESELKKEAADDAAQREHHGAAWNRPSSAALNSTLMEKIAGGIRHYTPLSDPCAGTRGLPWIKSTG